MELQKMWADYRNLHQSSPAPDSSSKVDYYEQHSGNIKYHNHQEKWQTAVVVPAYNEQGYLARSLAGINAALDGQSTSTQVIVVNNGSEDATAGIAQAFGAKVIDEPSKGIAYARQAGLEAVDSSVIQVLTTDADTLVPPEWVTAYINSFDSRTALLYGDASFFPDSDLDWYHQRALDIYQIGAVLNRRVKNRIGRWHIGGFNMGFSKEIALEVGGYSLSLAGGEDIDLAYKLASRGEIRRIDQNVLTSARRVLSRGFRKQITEVVLKNARDIYLKERMRVDSYEDFRVQ